jgi:hypothetical protein
MSHRISSRWRATALAVVLAGVLAWPAGGAAQTVTGQARAVQATVASLFGTSTTTLADTGTLSDPSDPRDAQQTTGTVPSVLSGEVLHAVTMGWTDQVASQASLADLSMSVGGTGISADFVMASALALLNAPATADSTIGNLAVNGVPVAVTGEPNQTISIPGGRLVINEQTVSPSGTTVNALHAMVAGVADVVIASATAGIQ